jgi:phospholipid-transporting ATPase
MSAYELLTANSQNEKQDINSNDKNNILKDKICVERFFLLICSCNDVYPTIKNDKICYQSTSPDDIALVRGAQQLGYEFQIRDYNNLIIKNYINHNNYNFEIFVFIPFTSDRKRMSILLRDINKEKYYIFSKGSDSVMIADSNDQKPLITIYNDEKEKKKLERILEHFSKEGLRILVMGYKEIDKDQAINLRERYTNSMKNNSKKREIFSEIEKDLIFCGCSAIEDKLQEGVPETIKTLMDCGIRIWVLTGDKKETAIQISKQCNLIEDDMFLYDLTKCKNEINLTKKLNTLCEKYKLKEYINTKNINLEDILNKVNKIMNFKDLAFIVDGLSLQKILVNKKLGRLFFLLGIISKSVICCRISPKQKSLVVDLIKSNGDFITLAIGDGANDIPMIMEASVGV